MSTAAERSITARVREADAQGFTGSPKELAAALDVDVRRVYAARSYLRRSPGAGRRAAQPGKCRVAFTGAIPADLRLERVRARSVACETCGAKRAEGCRPVEGAAFEWGVHVARARAAGCPVMPSVGELDAGVRPKTREETRT